MFIVQEFKFFLLIPMMIFMAVDVHKVMTNFFNVELNDFIARHKERRAISLRRTGGVMDFQDYHEDVLYPYAEWLSDFRDNVYRASPNFYQDKELLKKNLDHLAQFYVKIDYGDKMDYFDAPGAKDVLALKGNIISFFEKMDAYLHERYFSEKIAKMQSDIPVLTIRISDYLGFPIVNQNLEIEELLLPVSPSTSKRISVKNDQKTSENGIVRIRLLPGSYVITVPKYNKSRQLNVDKNGMIGIRVFDLGNTVGGVIKEVRSFFNK